MLGAELSPGRAKNGRAAWRGEVCVQKHFSEVSSRAQEAIEELRAGALPLLRRRALLGQALEASQCLSRAMGVLQPMCQD